MKEARIRTLEMIVNMTIAKLKILELRADDYKWAMIPKAEQTAIVLVRNEIDELLITLKKELDGK